MTSRRRALGAALVASFLPGKVFAQSAPLTPACGKQTLSQTEGPFFSPNSPLRDSLVEKSASATLKFVVAGRVLSPQCQPVAGALLDFWHADEGGAYDNQGFRYRGHQFADSQGRYRLETILPAEYPGRTRHFHVKVQAPRRRILTTQLYFAGDPGNRRDRLYRPELEMKTVKAGEGSFDFVIDA